MGYILHSLRQANDWYRELAGSFILVFIGTGALVTLNLNSQATTSLVIFVTLLAFAVPYAWITYIFDRQVSGYYNPIITLWCALSGALSISAAISLFLAQFAGALLASISVALLYGPAAVDIGLGAVYPNQAMGLWAAVAAEAIGAACLLATFASLSPQDSHLKKSVLLGFGLGMGLLAAVGISGAALNPVRNFAPQMAAADYTGWWVYWLGPLIAIGLLWVISYSRSAYSWLSGDSARAAMEAEALAAMYEQPVLISDEESADAVLERPVEPTELAIEQDITEVVEKVEVDEELPETVVIQSAAPESDQSQKTEPKPHKVKFVNFDSPVDIDASDESEGQPQA